MLIFPINFQSSVLIVNLNNTPNTKKKEKRSHCLERIVLHLVKISSCSWSFYKNIYNVTVVIFFYIKSF